MGTERVQEEHSYMKTPKSWESVWNVSKKAAADKVVEIFYQFNVTENISYSKYCPDATFYASSYVPLWKRSIVNSRKFQQEVKLGRHMCLCV